MLDVDAPLKVVLRELPQSIQTEKFQNSLNKEGLDIFRIIQMTSRRDERTLLLFVLHLPKIESSKRIFKPTSLYKITVTVEIYRTPRKASQ